MSNKCRLTNIYEQLIFVFLLVLPCKTVFSSVDMRSSESVKIEEGLISIKTEDAPLSKIVKKIEKKTGVEFKLMGKMKEKVVTVNFNEFSLLEGIKKLMYPFNYVITHRHDKAINKVIILDVGLNSERVAYKSRYENFVSSPPEDAGYVNAGIGVNAVNTYPGDEINRKGHPSMARNIEQTERKFENDPGEDSPGVTNAPGDSSMYEGASNKRHKGKGKAESSKVSTQFGSRFEPPQAGKECGTGFHFNDGANEGWRLIGLFDRDQFDPIPESFSDRTAPFSLSHNSPTATPYRDPLSNGTGSIYVDIDNLLPGSPSNSQYVHWDLNSPDLSGDVRWQGISTFSYDIVNAITSRDVSSYVMAALLVKTPDLKEEYFVDMRKVFHNNSWRTYKVNVKELNIPGGSTVLAVNLRIFFEVRKTYDGFIRVDNVIPSGSKVCSEEIATVIRLGDSWKFLKGNSDPGVEWNDVSFDDSGWQKGQTGIGYGSGEYKTKLSDMKDNYLALYARKTFKIDDATALTGMILRMDYDDGFVAYINGKVVARAHMPDGVPDHNTKALDHGTGLVEIFDLSEHKTKLVSGTNILVIEVHNESIGSTDIAFFPELEIKVQHE
ncbi:MAG: hypothetical protein MRK02_13930 [Candidatus Scalindua sp.]|nr:hypothetical protein [Candidatus Scalindua sp.]